MFTDETCKKITMIFLLNFDWSKLESVYKNGEAIKVFR